MTYKRHHGFSISLTSMYQNSSFVGCKFKLEFNVARCGAAAVFAWKITNARPFSFNGLAYRVYYMIWFDCWRFKNQILFFWHDFGCAEILGFATMKHCKQIT